LSLLGRRSSTQEVDGFPHPSVSPIEKPRFVPPCGASLFLGGRRLHVIRRHNRPRGFRRNHLRLMRKRHCSAIKIRLGSRAGPGASDETTLKKSRKRSPGAGPCAGALLWVRRIRQFLMRRFPAP